MVCTEHRGTALPRCVCAYRSCQRGSVWEQTATAFKQQPHQAGPLFQLTPTVLTAKHRYCTTNRAERWIYTVTFLTLILAYSWTSWQNIQSFSATKQPYFRHFLQAKFSYMTVCCGCWPGHCYTDIRMLQFARWGVLSAFALLLSVLLIRTSLYDTLVSVYSSGCGFKCKSVRFFLLIFCTDILSRLLNIC